MWKTVQSEFFNRVTVGLLDGGTRVYAKAYDDEGETFGYMHIWIDEEGYAVPTYMLAVAENFEYFSDDQRVELREIVLAETKIAAENFQKKLSQM